MNPALERSHVLLLPVFTALLLRYSRLSFLRSQCSFPGALSSCTDVPPWRKGGSLHTSSSLETGDVGAVSHSVAVFWVLLPVSFGFLGCQVMFVCLLETGMIDQIAVCEWGLSNLSLTLGCSLGGTLVG